MINEMRTYDLKPRSVSEVEKRFAEAYEHRKKHSLLAGTVSPALRTVNRALTWRKLPPRRRFKLGIGQNRLTPMHVERVARPRAPSRSVGSAGRAVVIVRFRPTG